MVIGDAPGITVPGENNILQSFSDATAGRSVQLYYGFASLDDSATDYHLGRDAGNSNPVDKKISNTSFDIDFDITINKPTIFAGVATIDCNWAHMQNGSEGTKITTLVLTLIHYDGSTETTLDTKTHGITQASGEIIAGKYNFTIATKLFKIGDILRLSVSFTTNVTSGRYSVVNFDPETAGNELKVWMPIRNLE